MVFRRSGSVLSRSRSVLSPFTSVGRRTHVGLCQTPFQLNQRCSLLVGRCRSRVGRSSLAIRPPSSVHRPTTDRLVGWFSTDSSVGSRFFDRRGHFLKNTLQSVAKPTPTDAFPTIPHRIHTLTQNLSLVLRFQKSEFKSIDPAKFEARF